MEDIAQSLKTITHLLTPTAEQIPPAVWNATKGDFKAREILTEITRMTANDSTNQLTTRIIFGDEKE